MPDMKKYSRLKEIANELMGMLPPDMNYSEEGGEEDIKGPATEEIYPGKMEGEGDTTQDDSMGDSHGGVPKDPKRRKMAMVISKLSMKYGKK